jgi:hypothetical protein
MELLIPGLALVALMVYASTRLKKATALALEPEQIETEHFSISKPAGFINVVSPDNGLLLQAYTKEFADAAPNMRKAEATVRIAAGTSLERELGELKQTDGFVSYKNDGETPGSPCLIRFDKTIDANRVSRTVKLFQDGDSVYSLQIDVPDGGDEEFAVARRELNESFELKSGQR